MANKIKETVEFFPFFVKNGRTLYVLQNKYGLAGIGFFTQMLRWLAQSPGHFYAYVDDFDKDRFNQYCGLNETDIRVMIGDMVRTGKVDRELWEDRGVIYSADFVEELSELYRKRKTELPTKERVMAETASICRNIPALCSKNEEKEGDFPQTPENTENRMKPRQYAGIFRQYSGNIPPNREQSRVEESIESREEVEENPAQPEPPSEPIPPEIIDNPQSKEISPMKDELSQHWQQMITRVQPHTTWSNYGKERSQLNQLAKKTKALYEETPYTDETELATAVFSQFLELRKMGSDKRIRGTPVIPSRVVQFWPEIVTAMAEQYIADQGAEEYDPEEMIF